MPKAKARTAEAESNIHAIVGSDESEVKRVAAELAAKLTPPDAGEFGLEVIDACADNVDQAVSRVRSAIEALQTLPFFGGGKLVWLKNANCLGDSPIGRSASVQSALDDLAELLDAGLGSDVTLLISATEVDKRRSFYKTLGKRAELQVIDRLDSSRAGWEEEATEIVRRRAKSRGLQFEEEALDLFVLLTGWRHAADRKRAGKDRPLSGRRSPGWSRTGARAGAAFACRCHLRAGKCARRVRPRTRAYAGQAAARPG